MQRHRNSRGGMHSVAGAERRCAVCPVSTIVVLEEIGYIYRLRVHQRSNKMRPACSSAATETSSAAAAVVSCLG